MSAKRTGLDARLCRSLPALTAEGVRVAVALAGKRGVDVYLVGGGVRDLLLGAPIVDVDLVVEGDALALAGAVGRALAARVVRHRRFGTAAVQSEGLLLDFARARTERYERPGALPLVRPGRLLDDLARRDFTINAIALRLTGSSAGALIDPFDGQADVSSKRLRVLHDASFQDDPTRALRAARYAGRLGFRLERHTASLLIRDLPYLRSVTGTRLRHELERIAGEPQAGRIVRLARRLGVLAAVHPALRPDERAQRAIARLPRVTALHRDAVLFCLLVSSPSTREAEAAIARLALTGAHAGAVRGYMTLRREDRRLARATLRPSAAARALKGQPTAAIEAFVLTATPLAARRARRYLEDWRFVRARLTGHDLEALGVRRGPQIGKLLATLRDARLDGQTRSREDEVVLVERSLRRRRPGRG